MPTQIRRPDLVRFTTGDCHVFAHSLEKETEWPIWCFSTKLMMPTDHAFVMHPSGDPVDIEGRHNLDQFLDRWGFDEDRMDPYPWSTLKAIDGWDITQYGKYSFKRARKLVPLVLEMVENRQYFEFIGDIDIGDQWVGV